MSSNIGPFIVICVKNSRAWVVECTRYCLGCSVPPERSVSASTYFDDTPLVVSRCLRNFTLSIENSTGYLYPRNRVRTRKLHTSQKFAYVFTDAKSYDVRDRNEGRDRQSHKDFLQCKSYAA